MLVLSGGCGIHRSSNAVCHCQATVRPHLIFHQLESFTSGFKIAQFQKDQPSNVPPKPCVTWHGKTFRELGSVICDREESRCIVSNTPWLWSCIKMSCDLCSYPEYISRGCILSRF